MVYIPAGYFQTPEQAPRNVTDGQPNSGPQASMQHRALVVAKQQRGKNAIQLAAQAYACLLRRKPIIVNEPYFQVSVHRIGDSVSLLWKTFRIGARRDVLHQALTSEANEP